MISLPLQIYEIHFFYRFLTGKKYKGETLLRKYLKSFFFMFRVNILKTILSWSCVSQAFQLVVVPGTFTNLKWYLVPSDFKEYYLDIHKIFKF